MAAHWLAELARRLQHTTRFNAQILPDRNLQVLRHVPFKEWNQYNKMQVSIAQRFCCGSQSKDHTHGTQGSVMESHDKEYRNEFSACISVAYYFPNSAWNKGIPHKSKCFPFFQMWVVSTAAFFLFSFLTMQLASLTQIQNWILQVATYLSLCTPPISCVKQRR